MSQVISKEQYDNALHSITNMVIQVSAEQERQIIQRDYIKELQDKLKP